MYFKKGIYWVYKDSLTGVEDSAWVDTSYIKMEFLEGGEQRNRLPYHSNTETFYVEVKRSTDLHIYMSGLDNFKNYPSSVLPGNTANINESVYPWI